MMFSPVVMNHIGKCNPTFVSILEWTEHKTIWNHTKPPSKITSHRNWFRMFRDVSICFDHSPNHLQNQVTQSNRRPNWYRSATATWWQPPTSSVARFFRVAGVAWKLKGRPGRGNASWLFSPGIIMSIASQWGKLGTVFSESTIPFFVTPMFRQPYDIHGSKSLMICFMIDGICCKP